MGMIGIKIKKKQDFSAMTLDEIKTDDDIWGKSERQKAKQMQ